MAQTVSIQTRPGVTAFFQAKNGSNPDDSNIGAIPTHYVAELDTTNATLSSIDGKTPALISGNSPVIIVQSSNGNFNSRNGNTSSSANTLLQLFPAQSTRTEWYILNNSETTTIELWFGAAGSEVLVDILDPGEKKYRSKWLTGFSSADLGRWCTKSTVASVPFIAHEVY